MYPSESVQDGSCNIFLAIKQLLITLQAQTHPERHSTIRNFNALLDEQAKEES